MNLTYVTKYKFSKRVSIRLRYRRIASKSTDEHISSSTTADTYVDIMSGRVKI